MVVRSALTRYCTELAVERSLQERQGVDQQRHEQLLSVVSQSLTETVNSKLDKVMKTEMKQSVVPSECVCARVRAETDIRIIRISG